MVVRLVSRRREIRASYAAENFLQCAHEDTFMWIARDSAFGSESQNSVHRRVDKLLRVGISLLHLSQ
jgi:hypothetical protein